MGLLKCGRCNEPLTSKTEIEYSRELSTFYCNTDCATDAYYEVMQSTPLEGIKDEMKSRGLSFKKGKLHQEI